MPETANPDKDLDLRKIRLPIGHADRRPFFYFCGTVTAALLLCFVRRYVCCTVHFFWPSRDIFAAAKVEVDLRSVRVGQNFVAKWCGKPVFILRRNQAQIDAAKRDDAMVSSMRDPQLDSERVKNPEWLIMVGLCTHLGCIPFPDSGDYNGYFCPCHGSHYDLSGRIRKGPAPNNLEVPPYEFLDDWTICIG
jgi:ubiquinol-cytochrome c reductase iron-sulfur subunit